MMIKLHRSAVKRTQLDPCEGGAVSARMSRRSENLPIQSENQCFKGSHRGSTPAAFFSSQSAAAADNSVIDFSFTPLKLVPT
jgi:hypothetical protein